MLTKKQAEVVSFINSHRSVNQYNPTMEEISEHFGWYSPNAATCHIRLLQKKGVIVKQDSGRYRVSWPYNDSPPC